MSYRTEFKVVTVGDDGVGKTCLLSTLNDKPFPTEAPTIFDNQTQNVCYEGVPYKLHMWDTAGNDEYGRLRPLAYSGANVVLICFSLVSKESFVNISKKWLDEVKKYSKDAIIILVGTKLDLCQERNVDHVTDDEISKFVTEQKCSAFIKCSSKNKLNIDAVFPAIIKEYVKKASAVVSPEGKDEQIRVLMSYIRFLEDRLSKYEPTKQINFEKLLNDQNE